MVVIRSPRKDALQAQHSIGCIGRHEDIGALFDANRDCCDEWSIIDGESFFRYPDPALEADAGGNGLTGDDFRPRGRNQIGDSRSG